MIAIRSQNFSVEYSTCLGIKEREKERGMCGETSAFFNSTKFRFHCIDQHNIILLRAT